MLNDAFKQGWPNKEIKLISYLMFKWFILAITVANALLCLNEQLAIVKTTKGKCIKTSRNL